jgi:AcrR family transcriptional regulator
MSSPGPVSLRERKKMRTRERLLIAAKDVFVERGYDAATVDEIAARADVSRATAFNYFPRKEDFLHGTIDERRRAIADLLAAQQERPISTGERLRHAIMALCDMLEADARTSRALGRAFVRAGGQLQPGASATAVLFADTIRFGQRQGDVRADIDAGAAGRVLLDAYVGAMIRWASENEPANEDLRSALDAVLEIVLAGLRPQP